MSSIAEQRLAAYLATEAAILQAQEVRGGDRAHRMADLIDVQKQIDRLQAQVSREQARAASGTGLNYALANLSGGTQ
jgi:hypothetical protein